MITSINTSSTLTGYTDGMQLVFFNKDAEKVAKVCNLETSKNYWGLDHVVLDENDTYKYYPKLVKAGYKIAIHYA